MTYRPILCCLLIGLSFGLSRAVVPEVHAEMAFTPYLAEATGDQVNVRAGQSANFERLCQLNKGEEVVVVEKGFSWLKVQLPPKARTYVSKKYVQFLGQNAGGVIAEDVNVRAGAGIHFTVLGQLAKGDEVTILEELDEWYRIKPVADSYGWVAGDLLTFKSNDVSKYRAAAYAPPVVDNDLVEKAPEAPEPPRVEPAVVPEPETAVQPVQVMPKTLTSVGYVEEYKENNDGIHYKIVKNGQLVCYIQGINHLLGRFLHQKVSVEGVIHPEFESRYAYPVITVTRVRLML